MRDGSDTHERYHWYWGVDCPARDADATRVSFQFLVYARPSDRFDKSALLTLDQKTKISEMITKRTPPLDGVSFPISVNGVVPTRTWRSGYEMDERTITTYARSTHNAYKWKEEVQWLTW
jgi:hypothetical protein